MMRVSAPGKLMLFGEHAAVYGKPCIVTAIDARLFVHEGDPTGDTRFLDAAVAAWGTAGTRLAAESAFSGAYGFGSSSAVTVAALKYLRPKAGKRELFDEAKRIVLAVQGKGSGFDVAAAAYGGTLYFDGGGTTIEPIDTPPLPLIVGYTGSKADTVALISDVEKKRAAQPERVGRIFDAIEKITDEAREALAGGDWQRVGTLMNFNQEYLRNLGVSSDMLERLIHAVLEAGAFGAKLSGAGGGDCMVALADKEHRTVVEDAIASAGGQVIHIIAGAPGVRVES